MHVFVRLLPNLLPRNLAADTVAIVIDVLRASTTILAALDAGATAVIPCTSIQEAKQVRQNRRGPVLLAGERHGLPIAGFDIGNSPSEYTPDLVAGHEIALTTTNGTRALHRCRRAASVIVAAFTNRAAVVERMAGRQCIELVCAGTDGSVTLEDVWLAGSLLDELARRGHRYQANDAGQLCRGAWQRIGNGCLTVEQLAHRFADTQGGRNLLALGLHNDLNFAAQWDRSSSVAIFDADEQHLRLA